jgi:hypothetical protein
MIWLLTKDGQHLRCEVAHAGSDGHFRITITRPGAPATVEDLSDPAAVIERTQAVMNELRTEGWQLA